MTNHTVPGTDHRDAPVEVQGQGSEPAFDRPIKGVAVALPPVRRRLQVVAAVAIYGLLAVTLVFVTPGLFGFHTYTGLGQSMGETIPNGSLVVARTVAADDVALGDVLVFRWPGFDQPITHRVIDIRQNDRDLLFATKGDGNPASDPFLASGDQELGRVILTVPRLGSWLPAVKALVYMAAFGGAFWLWKRHRLRRRSGIDSAR